MAGGTYTISNGGVFGSMMGTPIINLPQTAVLGLHAIKDRPMAINGKVEIRPVRIRCVKDQAQVLTKLADDVPRSHIRSSFARRPRSCANLSKDQSMSISTVHESLCLLSV